MRIVGLLLLLLIAGCQRNDAPGPMRNVVIGRIVGILDGNTVELLRRDGKIEPVRLFGIAAPRDEQPFSDQSKDYLVRLIANRMVEVELHGTDRNGQKLGEIYLDGALVNLHLLREGYAWHFNHDGDNESYAQAEAEARGKKHGLWMTPDPIPPWEWRARAEPSSDPER